MKESVLKDKSYAFSVKVVYCYKELAKKKEFVLSKQLLRSGTAIGALVREAEFGQSKADFRSKLSIALKEANETDYCLSLLKDTKYLEESKYQELDTLCKELIRILVASVKTSSSEKCIVNSE
ncbi:MAG: four helix bundle protein [Euryarchaeota archaeon]|nr:four helix bundle protein [Euryarchaeota archaeon]